jgi:RNA polymerase sigma-70 factor (ECF subfamily)
MRQLRAGNYDAFSIILDRYQRLVLSVALRIVKDLQEAEDIVQTVFLDIFRNVEKFDPFRGTLKVWLLQYAYSRSINRHHHLEQRQFYSTLELEKVAPFTLLNESWNGKRLVPLEVARLVRQALGTLDERHQVAIDLVYFEGLTFVEAAEKTGQTLSMLRHNYYRGFMKMREIINAGPEEREAQARSGAGREPISMEVSSFRPRAI